MSRGKSAGRCFLKPFFRIRENLFQSFRTKFLSLLYMISLAYKISHCLSANHNPELRCVICTGVTLFCTGVTLFALVLHFLHWCYTWTALLSANQNRVIFFMCIIILSMCADFPPQKTSLLPPLRDATCSSESKLRACVSSESKRPACVLRTWLRFAVERKKKWSRNFNSGVSFGKPE